MIKKILIYFIACNIFILNLTGIDDNYHLKLQKDFILGDINTKEQIIKSIPIENQKKYYLIYMEAIKYIENHYEILGNNKQFLKIGTIAINNIAALNEKKAIQHIRYIFSTADNERLKITCIKALTILIEKDLAFTNYLNTKYEEGLSDLIYGKKFNIELLIAYSEALEKFADSSSFEILFKTLFYPVDESLKTSVQKALNNIFFDYFAEILKKIDQKNLDYIKTLYLLAKDNKKIDNQKLGTISEAILSFAVDNFDANSPQTKELILETLPVFSKLKWNNASQNINEFFYIGQSLWKKSQFSTEDLIKIIECMGNTGTLETAKNLAIFLGVLNSQTEKTQKYDENLVLSIITSLKNLGSKIAFDYLLYIQYLDYNDRIKIAARQAIEELRW